jgi:hypothetical protein
MRRQSVQIASMDERATARRLRKFGPPRGCSFCGSIFQPVRRLQHFCTPKCRMDAYRERHQGGRGGEVSTTTGDARH